MADVEPEEVEMLISSPNQAQGNLTMQNEAKFRVLEKKVHMTHYVKKLYSNISSQLEILPCSTRWRRHMERNYTSMQRNTCSRVFPHAKPLGVIPASTITGPIQEVHIVEILDENGIEIAIPSFLQT